MEVRNPKWGDADKTVVLVEINYSTYGWIPFTANPNDCTDYGPAIYQAAVNGELGAVAEYVAPPPAPAPVPLPPKDGSFRIDPASGVPSWFSREKNGWVDATGMIVAGA